MTDLVFINATGVHQIWTRTGNSFELHPEQIFAANATSGVVADLGMTDVDDPGGFDLVIGSNVSSGAGVYLNDGFGNLGRGDAVPPILTLLGADPMSVPSDSAFVDPSASAVDNIDGDISNAVVASGAVNIGLLGSYTVTYNVSDFAGNAATPITRTVNVTPAVGTGGSGGGAVSPLAVLLMLAMFIAAHRRRRVFVVAVTNNKDF